MVKSLSLFLVFVLFFFYSCVSVSDNDKHTEGGDKQNIDLYNYNIEEKIQELGFLLPEPGSPVANYVSTVSFSETKTSRLVYVSGTGPKKSSGGYITGKLGKDLTIEEGYEAARITALNVLASLKKEVGDLNKIKKFVKVIGMVNCTPDFEKQPAVINGFSDFIVEVFGERGKHARSAVGMVSLPSKIAVEIEVVVEVLN